MNDDLLGIGDVRLIDQEGRMLGVVPVERALDLSRQHHLDLVEVDGDTHPPLCKMLDLAKYDWQKVRALRGLPR